MVKLFATDLDGTLLKRGNIIQDDDIKAIHKLKGKRIDFAIATGRMDRDIQMVCNEIKHNAHRISQNGAFVDTKDNKTILTNTFDAETSKELHKAVEAFPNPFSITTQFENYVSFKTPEIKKLEDVLYFPLIEGVDFLDEYGGDFLPSKFMLLGEQHELLPFQQELNAHFHKVSESYLSDPHCVDIVPKHVSKAVGLQTLAEQVNIAPTDIAVIGDSFNDIPMFDITPHSFAMSTAPSEVQQKAKYVVDEVHEAIDMLLK